MHGIATRRGTGPAAASAPASAAGAAPAAASASVAAPAAAPVAALVPRPVLACRRGEVLDLSALPAAEARAMFTMPAEAWQALEEAPGQPPITEVRLPQAARPRHLTQAVRGLNRLAHLRRLSLPAPGGGGKVSLQELAHPAHQLTVSLDLPESGGCTIDRPPRLALRLARPLTMPATGKHAVRIVTPGEAPREPRRTLPDWPYLRDIGPRGVGQLLRLRLTREEAMRRGLQRLLRQALIQARATPGVPNGPVGHTAAATDRPVDPADAAMARGFQAMSADAADLPALRLGLDAAFARLGQAAAGGAPPPRTRYRYGYAATAEGLARLIGPTLERAVDHLLHEPPLALLEADALGRLLAQHLDGLRAHEARFLLLHCGRGAVAIILKRRPNQEASVVCHDPQLPATHVRLVTQDRDALAQVSLRRLMTPASFETCFGLGGPRIVGAYDVRQLLPASSRERPPRAHVSLIGILRTVLPSPQVLETAMRLGPAFTVSDSLHAMDARAVRAASSTPATAGSLEAMSARIAGPPGEQPLLVEALRRDRLHLAAAWLDAVLAAQAFEGRPQARARLLRAHHVEAAPRARAPAGIALRDSKSRDPVARAPWARDSLTLDSRAHDPWVRGAVARSSVVRDALRSGTLAQPAENPTATTALSTALHHSPQGTGLWVRQLLAANPGAVSPILKRILLLEAEAEGGPLLHRLLGPQPVPGQAAAPLAGALYAYAYEVAASANLDEAVRHELLRAVHQGEPAMMAGLREGHGVGVAAIACALLEAPMAAEARARLLEAVRVPMMALATALDLGIPSIRYWVGRMLPRLGRPGTDAALSVRLRQAWDGLGLVELDWATQPPVRALLAAEALQVAGTDHTRDGFALARLRALEPDPSRLLMVCSARHHLRDLDGWRLAPGMRPQAVPAPAGETRYLLPIEMLSPLADAVPEPRAVAGAQALASRPAPGHAPQPAGPGAIADVPPRPSTPAPESKGNGR